MGGESCNLDKDEAEILKPSSSSPPPPSPPTSPPSIFCKPQPPPSQQPSLVLLQHHEATGSNDAQIPESKVASCFRRHKRKREELEEEEEEEEEKEEKEENSLAVRLINRCSSCRKRVGLAGFRCRCGNLFCARHRYSDIHHCSFDYKTAGREEIAKANPVIRAAKIIRI